jgi:hypothetical protein
MPQFGHVWLESIIRIGKSEGGSNMWTLIGILVLIILVLGGGIWLFIWFKHRKASIEKKLPEMTGIIEKIDQATKL